MASKTGKSALKRLQVMICLPCDNQPAGERLKVVRVSDGERTELISYGRHQPVSSIMRSIPMHFMDRAHDDRRRRKVAK